MSTALTCPFCHSPMNAVRLDQIEVDSYLAALDCSGCGATVTTQYSESTIAQAIQAVQQLWDPLSPTTNAIGPTPGG